LIRRFFKVIALIVIGAFVISYGSMIIAGQFLVPYIPLVSPEPTITGFMGYYAGILALCLIPMILIARAGFGLVWNHKFDPKIRRILLGAWLVSFIVFGATVIFGVRNFAFHGSSTSSLHNAPIDKTNPFIIQVNSLDSEMSDGRIPLRLGHSRLDNGKLYISNRIHFRLQPSEDENLKIDVTSKSRGSSPRKAQGNTQLINHSTSIEDNTISINEYYSIDRKSRFRGQYRSVDIHIPIGQEVILKGSANPYNRHDFKKQNPHNNKHWVMTTEGLIANVNEAPSE
jgi:hypothetical protein